MKRLSAILRVVCGVLLVAGGGDAAAQSLSVQSGEHDGFTRLVIDIGPDRTWDMERVSTERVQLAFTPAASGFGLDQIFDRIPRTRLLTVRERNGLALGLGCDCTVTLERYRARYLIVDILDEGNGTETNVEDDRARQLAASEALPDLGSLALQNRTRGQLNASPPTQEQAAAEPSAPDAALEDAARIMAEQLARAAAAGLLEPAQRSNVQPQVSHSDPDQPTDTLRPEQPFGVEPVDLPSSSEQGATPQTLAVSAENAFDVALDSTLQSAPSGPSVTGCGAVPTDVGDWASGSGLYHDLGAIRQALYSEDGELVEAEAEALARHYLYYGFGAEAAYWLRQLPHPPEALLRLAQLVDGDIISNVPTLDDPETCTDQAVFWVYAMDSAAAARDRNEARRLQRAATALPMGLQDRLLPDVARRLYQDGFPNEARNLRDALVRGQRLADATLFALDLDLGLLAGDDDPTNRDRLASALRDDGGAPARLMAHALRYDRLFTNGTSNTRLVAAEALLRETSEEPSPALWQEIVLAHAERSNIDTVLHYMQTDMPDAVRRQTLTELFRERLDAADTASLYILALVFGSEWTGSESDTGRTRVAAINHLRAVGLSQAVEALRSGHQPLILPARPSALPAPTQTVETAWQAADWEEIAQEATTVHGDIARRMQDLRRSSGQDVQLSELARQVADTRDLRSQITALLQDPSPRQELRP